MIEFLRTNYSVGLKRISSIVGYSRSSYYYQSKLNDTEIIEKLNELVEKKPNRGFDYYFKRSRREGCKWSRGRMLRVYRKQGLVRRSKKRKKLPIEQRKPLYQPKTVNEIWSMDFMSDSLSDRRAFRILNVIDDHNRECLLSQGSISFPSEQVIRYLEELIEYYGKPKYIRTDNGPEFTSNQYKTWCKKKNIIRVYSEPGKPMQNGYIERFNRTFREDVLDAYIFDSLTQFQVIADKMIQDYNDNHPHESLGGKSPKEYGKPKHPIVSLS
ncbi:IS3 family transposase [Aquimarina sp. SS2-1]|uniref:IS3 family transposase n=1 Tax=Aquimarina besae TaxID=3342247 RepID=UPI00366DE71F